MGAHTSQNSPRGHILLPGVQKLSELMRKAACQRQPGDQGPRRLFQADAGLGPTPDRARAERRGETHFPGRGPSSLGQGVNPESSAPTPGSLPPMPLGRSPAGALQGESLPPEGTLGAGAWRWAFEAHSCPGAAGRHDLLNSSSDLGLQAGEESGRIALPSSSSEGGPTAAVRSSCLPGTGLRVGPPLFCFMDRLTEAQRG